MIIIRAWGEGKFPVAVPQGKIYSIVQERESIKLFAFENGDDCFSRTYNTPEQARVAFEHLSRNFGEETVDVLTPVDAQEALDGFSLCLNGHYEPLEWLKPYFIEWLKAQEGKEE